MAATDWEHCVARVGACCACRRELAEQEDYHATLVEVPEGFQRRDYCCDCWNETYGQQAFSFWQARIPARDEKRKLFVDNEVLMQVFRRLVDSDDESKRAFAFVLTLILMRKRLLKYVATENRDDEEWWVVRVSGGDERFEICNPNLAETELEHVREQLNEVLAGD